MTKPRLFFFLLFLIGMLQGAKAQLAYAVLSDDGKTVTFYYDTEKFSRTGVVDINQSIVDVQYGSSNVYWTATTAVFDASFADYRPVSTAFWFWGCTKLTSILGMEFLNTASVKDMSYMFRDCSSLASLDVGNFNTANVTNIRGMFEDCSSLTSLDLSNFNTDNVIYMYYIFSGCSSLTSLDVSNFNTSKVKHLRSIFSGCGSLASLDVSNFNTDNVTSMSSMFSGCSSLTTLDVRNFNTSNVTDMSSVFSDCGSLTTLDVSNFNTDKVTSMSSMFSGCSSLTSLDLCNFNTDNVKNMSSMFSGCSSLKTLDVRNFNTDKVTNMSSMFSGCSSLALLNISNFNTISVTRMGSMFSGCGSLASLDVSNFNTSNVTDMSSVFSECGFLKTLDVRNFNTDKVTSMSSMFSGCSSLTSLDLCNFNTDNVKNMSSMFYGCVKLKTIYADEGWNTEAVILSTDMFHNCIALSGSSGTTYDANHTDVEYALIDGGRTGSGYLTDKSVSPVVNAEAYAVLSSDGHIVTFYYDTDKNKRTGAVKIFQNRIRQINEYLTATNAIIDQSFADYHPISTAYWFSGCTKLTSISGIEYLSTSKTTDMRFMFSGCGSLTSLNLSDFNTSNVTDMCSMFRGCSSLTLLDLSNFNTSYVTYLDYMFEGCSSLTSLDISNFNTSNVTNMYRMFSGCSSLISLDVSNFNTSKVSIGYRSGMAYMFFDCNSLISLDLGSFNTSNVPNMESMFSGCSNLTSLDIRNFNTSKVKNMYQMFKDCVSLETIYVGEEWTTVAVTEGSAMFENCTALVGGTGTAYDANHIDAEYARIDGGTSNPGYLTEAKTIHDNVAISAKSYTREYGEENPKFEYDVTEGSITSGTPEVTCEATTTSSVGTYDIVISKGSVSNNEVALTNGTLTITKAPLTIKAKSYTIVQGEDFPDFKEEYEGFKNGETSKVLTKLAILTTTAFNTKEPGTYDIVASSAEAENYEISYVMGTLTIKEAEPVKVTAKSYTIEYGESIPAFEYTSEGAALSGTPEIRCEATAASAAGTYDIVISKGSVSNFNDTYVNGTLTITKAPLVISVGEYTRQEGEENPEFELTYEGFKNGESDGVLSKQPVVTCVATKDSEPGEYVITIDGAEAENYDIRYAPGKLTVTPKPLPEITPIEGEISVNTEGLSEADLTDNVVNDVYYNVGEQGYDAAEKSIVISEATNMAQITDKEPGSKDVKESFNGIILKVGKGFGLITISAKTSGNAQLVVQVGESGMPMIASRTEKGDVVVSYDVSEDTYVYIYAIKGSSAAKLVNGDVKDNDSDIVRIYGITVSPGATGIRNINANGNGNWNGNDDAYYTLDGKKLDTAPKKGGIYVRKGRLSIKR